MVTNYIISHQSVLEACASAFKELNIKGEEAQYLLDKLEIIFAENSIEPYLEEQIAISSYKEVYKFGENHVIKFCAIDNDTTGEIDTMYIAEEEGIADIFAPSCFIPIPAGCKIRLKKLIDYNDIEPRNYYAHYLIIQPVAETLLPEECTYFNYSNYEKTPLIDGDKSIPIDEVIDLVGCVDSIEWLQSIIDCYGKDFFDKVVYFIHMYDIDFLTQNNLGYINGKPVILDTLFALSY